MTANIRRTNATENDNTVMTKPVIPPNKADFNGIQLDLFRYFLCNTVEERDQLSNTFDPINR